MDHAMETEGSGCMDRSGLSELDMRIMRVRV